MSKAPFEVDRRWVESIAGGFIAFGEGADPDQAFDAAVIGERFRLGTSRIVPSLADADPLTVVHHHDPVHPYQAVQELVSGLIAAPAGTVLARAVTPLSAYRYLRRRTLIDSLEHRYPEHDGLIVPVEESLRRQVLDLLDESDHSHLVGIELHGQVRRKYKVETLKVTGTGKRSFAVLEGTHIVSVHETQSLARRAAVEAARAHPGTIALKVQPLIGRENGEPFVHVRKNMVSQRAVMKAVVAIEKRPEKRRCVGWLFAGTGLR